MDLINLIYCFGILLLLYSSLEDLIFRELFSNKNNIGTFLFFIHPILLISTFFSSYFLPIICTSLLGICLLIVFYFKSKNHIVSYTLEHHYESITTLLIILISIGSFKGALFTSLTILISSLSAGYAKTKSSLWTKKPDGMKMFLTMPWLSRKKVINLFNNKSENFIFKDKLLRLISKLTPYFQILSTLLIFSYALFPLSYEFKYVLILCILPLFFQFLFPILLFIIGGLGLIPFYYLFCLFVFLSTNQIDFSANFPTSTLQITNLIHDLSFYFSLIYFSLYLISSLGFINLKLAKSCGPFIRKGPFHMYTERNMLGMIVFHYIPKENSTRNKILFPQPFDIQGRRSRAQNFTSQKFYCLYYSVMDFILWNQSNKECELKKFNYKSKFNFNVMLNIFSYLKNGKISLIQFNWKNDKNSFESNAFANIYFDSQNSKLNLKYFSDLLPCSH